MWKLCVVTLAEFVEQTFTLKFYREILLTGNISVWKSKKDSQNVTVGTLFHRGRQGEREKMTPKPMTTLCLYRMAQIPLYRNKNNANRAV